MSELNPNDRQLIATEYFDGALGPEELAWFEENGLASDPVVKETLEGARGLRELVRRGARPEPPATLAFYWERVRADVQGVGRAGARPMRASWRWATPVRVLATAAAVLVGIALVLPRGGSMMSTVERAESRQPGLYTSVVPARGASVVWITGLEYLPEGYVLR